MKASFACAFLAALLMQPVLAQESPASREEILELLDLMRTRDMTRQVMQIMTSRARAQFRSMPNIRDSGLPDEVIARFETILETLLAEMVAEYPVDEILEDIVPVYQKYLTSADVRAMIAFYSTPTGQKVIRDMPAIMAESMQASQPRLQQQMENFRQKVQAAIRELLQQLPGAPAPEI